MNDRESYFLPLNVLYLHLPIKFHICFRTIYCKIETEGRSNLSFMITSDGAYLTYTLMVYYMPIY